MIWIVGLREASLLTVRPATVVFVKCDIVVSSGVCRCLDSADTRKLWGFPSDQSAPMSAGTEYIGRLLCQCLSRASCTSKHKSRILSSKILSSQIPDLYNSVLVILFFIILHFRNSAI